MGGWQRWWLRESFERADEEVGPDPSQEEGACWSGPGVFFAGGKLANHGKHLVKLVPSFLYKGDIIT